MNEETLRWERIADMIHVQAHIAGILQARANISINESTELAIGIFSVFMESDIPDQCYSEDYKRIAEVVK
jgi:hypothetical protein